MNKEDIKKYFPCFTRDKLYELIKEGNIDSSIYKQFESYFDKYRFWFKSLQYGDLEVINFFVDAGIDIEAKSERGFTPLMYAAYYGIDGNLEVVKFLVESGVNINAEDNYGRTALMLLKDASPERSHINYVFNKFEIQEFLVDNGASTEWIVDGDFNQTF